MTISTEQFARMVEQHTPMLLNLGFRLLRDRQEAEDAVQETFRCAWAARDKFDWETKAHGLLATILRRRVIDSWRKPSVPMITLRDEVITFDVDPSHNEFNSEINDALDALPNSWRDAFLMVVVDDYTHREAADKLGVPLGTVLSQVSRAKSRLRENLTP